MGTIAMGFSSIHSCLMMKMLLILLISITIAFNSQIADGRRLLKRKSVQDKFSAQHIVVKEELTTQAAQSLSEWKQSPAVAQTKKSSSLKNKLPSGSSPGTGHAYINDGGVKSSWRSASIFKAKHPSSPSPGVGH